MPELVREILIDATPETIFPFLTEPEKYIEWEGTEAELDPRPGGVYRVLIAGEHQSAGEFVEVVPNERVVYTFGWEQEGNPITPGLHPGRDHAPPRGHRRRGCAWCTAACRTTGRRRPQPGLGPLPRAARHRRHRRHRPPRRAGRAWPSSALS